MAIYQDSEARDVMASEAELHPPVTGEPGGTLRGDGLVPGLPEDSWPRAGPQRGAGPAAALDHGHHPVETMRGLTTEPPSGMTIRARYLSHHTAALIFTRDDPEGHSDRPDGGPQHWWCHDYQEWMSWEELLETLNQQEALTILEPMFTAAQYPGCPPDGMHNENCPTPWTTG